MDVLAAVVVVGAGMVAGLLFAFSSFVMRALGGIPVAAGVHAMQEINRRIINPLFLLIFVGTAAGAMVLLAFEIVDGEIGPRVIGCAVYLVGVGLITAARNVPMNNALDLVDGASSEAPAAWVRYQKQWTRWNHIRTVAAVAATALILYDLVWPQ